MSRTWRDYLILGFVLAVGLWRVGTTVMAGPSEQGLRITLHVYNYAHVTEKMWLEAEKQATAIFRKVGVETVWHHVPLPPENRTSVNRVQPPSFNLSPLDLRIYVVPRSRAQRMDERLGRARENVFGLSPPTRFLNRKPCSWGLLSHMRSATFCFPTIPILVEVLCVHGGTDRI